MTRRSATLDEIRRQLRCPSCDYALCGLTGDQITCPECGVVCDVARMATRRWTRPWFDAPGFQTILMPVTWGVIGLPFWAVSLGVTIGQGLWIWMAVFTALYIGGWAMLLHNVQRRFHEGGGVTLAFLAHALLAGYCAGTAGVITVIIWVIANPPIIVVAIPLALVPVVVLIFCRRGERAIAERCIRRYLAGIDNPDTIRS
ncbi:MAG: hypothetical protein AAF432_16960 [Planctomycetota bacterium]